MPRPLVWALLLIGVGYSGIAHAQSQKSSVVINAQPLHDGRINPRLFGNFIELLDDVVPSLWAEMLNDRSLEGVKRTIDAVYYDGTPNFCDRQWDQNASVSYSTDRPWNGSRCAKLTPIAERPASLTQSGLAVKKGSPYLVSGWLRRGPAAAKATVLIKTLLPSGEFLPLASADLPALTDQWTRFSVRLNSIGTTDRAIFELRVDGAGPVWADRLSLMPTENLHGWRPDIVQAIKDLHPTLIRWGGSVCDPGEYRWKDGIGERDRRVPFTNKNWGRIDQNDVGIDEFCQLCELTGIEPLVCLSFSDGPQSAADLVEYCNGDVHSVWGGRRAANGHAQPYRVKYWQVGNEISGDDPAYLDQFGKFVAQMRERDKDILLMSSFPSQALLERHGNEIAYVGPHHYTRDLAACERDFKHLAEMIAHTKDCAHIKVAVTEWNESGGDWGLGRGRQMALQNALHNASYMNLLMRHSDQVEIACRSSMANSFCGGLIETSPSGLLKRPGYYALQLYARHFRPVPLRVETSKGGPDVLACADEKQKSLTLFIVNAAPQNVDVSYRLNGFVGTVRAVKAQCLCDTLHAHQPDVMNHWQAPDRIRVIGLPAAHDKVSVPPLSVTAVECELN